MYTIDKQFEFEYGHRVWTQTLDERFSLDNRCICRHLHGHHAIVKLHLAAKELTDGMVTDFKHLNCFKQFLDDVLDHRFIIDENDPLFLLDSAIINDYIDHGFYRTVDNNVPLFFDQNHLSSHGGEVIGEYIMKTINEKK